MVPKNLALISPEHLVMMVRILGALAIGAVIGLERTFHGRPASAPMRWCASPRPC